MSQKKSQARRHAVQAIYQWQMVGHDIGDIVNQFLEEQDLNEFDVNYFQELLRGVPQHLDVVDELLKPALDRVINSVDPVERAILRLGAFELAFKPEVPYRVVINEAVELAKVFGAEMGHKYVNGVLDRVAKDARAVEIEAKKKS